MRCPPYTYLAQFHKRFIPVILISLFLIAPPVLAEPLLFLDNKKKEPMIPEAAKLNVQRPVAGLNENGDLVIHCGDVSLAIAYNPFTDVMEPQKHSPVSQKQDSLFPGGISLTVAFMF